MSLPKEILDEKHPLGSFSDWVNTLHEIDVKVSKLHEVMVGNKEFGQEGILQRLKNIEDDLSEIDGDLNEIKKIDPATTKKEVEDLKSYKNKLVGISIAMGVFIAIIWELVKALFKKG